MAKKNIFDSSFEQTFANQPAELRPQRQKQAKNKPIVHVVYTGEYYFPVKVPRRVPCRMFYFNLQDLLDDFPPEIYKVKIDYSSLLFEIPIIEINPF